MTELLSKLIPNNPDKTDWGENDNKSNRNQVELIIVAAGHQVFGLLMSQVFNIVRPGSSGLQVLKEPNLQLNRQYGEVLYRDETLRVLELTRQLQLPLVEPIERSKILLTGQLKSDNTVVYQFGVAIDDIVTLRRVNKNDLRLLPNWLCGGNIKRLVWGVALIESQILNININLEYQSSALPIPFQLEDSMRASNLLSLEKALGSDGGQLSFRQDSKNTKPNPITPVRALTLSERLAQRERRVEQVIVDTRRALMLLDLQALQSLAYPEKP